MPVNAETVLDIVCDNPECPGNELDPTSREGWTFVTAEVYGQPMGGQKVYCCPMCAGHVTVVLEEAMVMDAQTDGESLPSPTDQAAVSDVSGMRSDQDGYVVPTGDTGSTDPAQ